jgi:hypothetical protein
MPAGVPTEFVRQEVWGWSDLIWKIELFADGERKGSIDQLRGSRSNVIADAPSANKAAPGNSYNLGMSAYDVRGGGIWRDTPG